jgi:GTPase SAR1 family protein
MKKFKQNLEDISKAKYKLKIIIIGDANVGKTALATRFIDNKFIE